MKLPVARNTNLVVQTLSNEVLVYDLLTNEAFCLNDTAAKIFGACDGSRTFADLQRKYKFTDEIIYLALDGLKDKNLLTGEYVSPFAGLSRREALRKVGFASMIALPVISGLVAPSAAHAASVCATPGRGCGCVAGTPFNTTCGRGNGSGFTMCPGNCSCRVNFVNCGTATTGSCTGNCE